MPLITPFDPWKSKYCTCPDKFSLSPYTGCGHACLYCYASSYIRNFFNPRPKKDFIKRLENQMKKIPKNSIITIANSSDPYQSIEKEYKLTRKMLILLKNYELKINIVTKSTLVARDVDIFKSLKNVVVSFTFTCLDKRLMQRLEPGCAGSPQDKLKTINALSKYIPVAARFDPLIYPLNTKDIRKTVKALKNSGAKQIITSTYKTKPDNFKRMCETFPGYACLWKNLYLTCGGEKGGYNYLTFQLRQKLIEEVKEAALNEKLKFSSCREGFSAINTADCDGSSLFLNL
ncbi:MAG: radical SAM protein [Candidatus Omnitrophica bacterium]|jgi:DNA repair photolyase|nr:radical SAM protein [Candidatus Omnitrophota bacterium]